MATAAKQFVNNYLYLLQRIRLEIEKVAYDFGQSRFMYVITVERKNVDILSEPFCERKCCSLSLLNLSDNEITRLGKALTNGCPNFLHVATINISMRKCAT